MLFRFHPHISSHVQAMRVRTCGSCYHFIDIPKSKIAQTLCNSSTESGVNKKCRKLLSWPTVAQQFGANSNSLRTVRVMLPWYTYWIHAQWISVKPAPKSNDIPCFAAARYVESSNQRVIGHCIYFPLCCRFDSIFVDILKL